MKDASSCSRSVPVVRAIDGRRPASAIQLYMALFWQGGRKIYWRTTRVANSTCTSRRKTASGRNIAYFDSNPLAGLAGSILRAEVCHPFGSKDQEARIFHCNLIKYLAPVFLASAYSEKRGIFIIFLGMNK